MQNEYLYSLEKNLPRVPGADQVLHAIKGWDNEASPELWIDRFSVLASFNCVSHVYLDPIPGEGCRIGICIDGLSLSTYQFPINQQQPILAALENVATPTGIGSFFECVGHKDGQSFWVSRVDTVTGPQVTICRLKKWDSQEPVWVTWPQRTIDNLLQVLKHPNGLSVFCHRGWNTEFGAMAKVLYSIASERSRYYHITEGQVMVDPRENVYQLRVDGTKASWDQTLGSLNRENADVVTLSGRDENEVMRQALLTTLQDRKVFVDSSIPNVLNTLEWLTSGSVVDPILISEVLIGVFGVYGGLRHICQDCAVPGVPGESSMQILKEHGINTLPAGNWMRSIGCEKCNRVGFTPDYSKWLTVAESAYVDRDMARILATRPNSTTLRGILSERGFQTYLDCGLNYAQQGLTTVQEAIRVGVA